MTTAAQFPPDSFDLDAYLRRINYQGERAARLAVLQGLHRAHAYTIPFENLDILLGRPIRVDLAGVQAKLVGARRGGYCFEHNTLFTAALRRLGFAVTTLAARVWIGRPDKSHPSPRTHMLLRVDLPEGPWLADVGFGGSGLIEPMQLVPAQAQEQPHGVYRLRREGSEWTLELRGESWQDLYSFTLQEQLPIDYEVANHYTSTHPNSHFLHHLTAALASPEGRLTLYDRRFAPAGSEPPCELDDDALVRVLRDRFGIALPEGTRFRCAGLGG